MASIAIAERDTRLMLGVRAGDETCFEILLCEYREPIIRFLYRMTQNRTASEELAQEVFLRLYRARLRYQPTARLSTWMFCIATRLALNWRRDTRKQWAVESLDSTLPDKTVRQISDPRPSMEEHLVHRAAVEEIRRAVHELPNKQRAAVVMHKYHDMDYSQIARVLGCSESAVKSLLFRAYERLRKSLVHLATPAE